MPDVKLWLDPYLRTHRLRLDQVVAEAVAENMSCEVDGEYYHLDHKTEIDTTVIGEIDGVAGSQVIIEVAAYNFPDRMANISVRIETIAKTVKKVLERETGDHIYVSVTFIPIQQGCWVKV